MKYLMTYQSKSKAPPTAEQMGAIWKFGEEMKKAGVLLMTGGLIRPSHGTHLRLEGGQHTVLKDGPFAETKELIDGFALIRANSLPEAIEHAQRFMDIAGEGDSEILQVFDSDEIPGK